MDRQMRSSVQPDDERRWNDIEASLGSIADTGHEWDEDPEGWVREQRSGDPRRSG